MNQRRILLFILLAGIGYTVLVYLFPRFHPTVAWGQRLDRAQIIALAKIEANRFGLDATNWSAKVETELQRDVTAYLADKPHPQIASMLSTLISRVEMRNPKSNNRITIGLSQDGRLLSVSHSELKPETITTSAETRRIAESAFEQLIGTARSRFAFKSATDIDADSKTFIWEMIVPDEDRVKVIAEAKLERKLVKEISLSPIFSQDYLDGIRNQRQRLNDFSIAFPILLLLGLLLALISYIQHIIGKEIKHRSTFTLLAGIFLLLTIWNFSGGAFADVYSNVANQSSPYRLFLGVLLACLIIALLNLLFSSPFFVLWAAGYPFASRQQRNPLRALELLICGRMQVRLVSESILIGLALGWIIPVMILIVSGIRLFPHSELREAELHAEIFTAYLPLLTRPSELTAVKLYACFTLFAFFSPFVLNYLRRPLLTRLLTFTFGVLCFIGASDFQSSIYAALVVSVLAVTLLDQLTYRIDFLATIVALLIGDFAVKLCVLTAQPSPSLQTTGQYGWALLATMIISFAVATWRGRELSEEEARVIWTTERQRSTRVERERLKAEFEVARRAQQQMLPNAPPEMPGVDISAICRPAREVGGDLYDFLKLPDGRLGIVVADVSGKGVSASLYMTLTKGLIASTAENTSDPGEILCQVNRHLYIACRKKVFVTLLLGVIDLEEQIFTYARAGHNPPVWRQKTNGKTTLLHAPGLGLGLNKGEIFNRALKVESIRLSRQDMLFLYSDGITEAMNERREEYGESRLMEIAARADGLSAEMARDTVLADVSAFLGKAPPQDDQTLVVVRFV